MLFWLCDSFFRIFLNVYKESPFIFFHFATEWMFKNPKGSLIFRHYATYRRLQKNAGTVEENTWHFEPFAIFSRRFSKKNADYSSDFF